MYCHDSSSSKSIGHQLHFKRTNDELRRALFVDLMFDRMAAAYSRRRRSQMGGAALGLGFLKQKRM